MRRNIMRKNIVAFYILSLINLSCGGTQDSNQGNSSLHHSEVVNKNILISVEKIFEEELPYKIYSNGKIASKFNFSISSPIDGTIVKSELKNGRRASENGLILLLKNDDIEFGIRKIRATLFNNNLNFKSDSISQSRLNSIDDRNFTDTVLKRLEIESGLAASKIELDELQSKQKRLSILSPVSGIIYDAQVGQKGNVKEGDELFKIYSHEHMQCSFKVMEDEIKLLKIGDKVKIHPQALNKYFSGIISEINPIVDDNGAIEIKADIFKPVGLFLGMNTEVEIQVQHKKRLWVPKKSVVKRSGKDVIFSYEDGKAKWNDVVIGLENGDKIEIQDGISSGSTIILSNNNFLSHNSEVIIKQQ